MNSTPELFGCQCREKLSPAHIILRKYLLGVKVLPLDVSRDRQDTDENFMIHSGVDDVAGKAAETRCTHLSDE